MRSALPTNPQFGRWVNRFPEDKAPPLQLLAKVVALRLLNRRTVGGIIGKLSFERDETLARPVLEQMLGALRHRGRAACGIHVAPGIALGWCGDDPAPIASPVVATNDEATIRVVADSSLTNAAALRRELARRGHAVRGRSEAELLVYAFLEWGDACVEHLRGPFACAIWDQVRQRLLLARDAMGVRPLFFAMLHGHGVVFGSEIRALLQDPGVGREWCPQAIDAYLALGYVPSPLTAYQRISKVEPAQRLIVEGHRLRVDYYWDLPLPDPAYDERTVMERLPAMLQAATPADSGGWPPDVLYSGGIASSTLLAAMTPSHRRSEDSHRGARVVTVTFGDEPGELERRTAAARDLGFDPIVEPAAPDASAIAPRLAAQFDEPLADPAAVSQYAVLAAARLHTASAVAGYGAAALWAGFPQPGVGRTASTLSQLLRAPRAPIGALAHPWPHAVTSRRPLAHLNAAPAPGDGATYGYGFWDDEFRHALYTRTFAWQVRDAQPLTRHTELFAARATDDPVDRALYVDARTFLPDNRLAVAERTAAAAGIRLHLPFLDREVVEFAARVPASVRRRLDGMHPLQVMLSHRLPEALVPHGLRLRPRQSWLPAALVDLVPRVLLARRFDGRGIVSRPVLRQLWEDHLAGRRDHSHRLWSLLMLEFWFREFIDGDAVDEPLEYAILRAA